MVRSLENRSLHVMEQIVYQLLYQSLRQRLYIKLRGAREVSDVRYFSPDAKVMSKVMSNCCIDMETTANQRITTTSHLELEFGSFWRRPSPERSLERKIV